MKKVLLTLTAILTLASCQDKFEQIDANFLYQQEQIEAIKQNLEDKVSGLQSQINRTNENLENEVTSLTNYIEFNANSQNEVNEFIFFLISELESADAEILTYVTELDAIQAELINASADKIADLEASQESIEADLNTLFSELETTFVSKFNELAVTTQNGVANVLAGINFDRFTTAWTVNVDNTVTNITEVTEIVTGTASSSTASGSLTPPPPPAPDTLSDDLLTYITNAVDGETFIYGTFTVTYNDPNTFKVESTENGFTTQYITSGNTAERHTVILNLIN